MDDKKKRVISAVVAVPLLIIFVVMGGLPFSIAVAAITLIAVYEYRNSYDKTENKVIPGVIILGYLLTYFSIFFDKNDIYPMIAVLITILSMAVPIFNKKYNVISSALTVLGFIYLVTFFSTLIYIRNYNNGLRIIWIVFIIAWFCDTFAYYSGRFLGKRKLCPDISPKKTVEGSIGGIAGSIFGLILWWLFNREVGIPLYHLVILGAIGAVVSQLGDLSASMIKRYSKIKDYGKIMPGHGGILDRFDSILFTSPLVYYYIVIFMGK